MYKKCKAAALAAFAIVYAVSVAGCGAASGNRTASSAATTTSAATKSQKTTKTGQTTTKAGSTTGSASVAADGTTIAVNPSGISEGITEGTASESPAGSDVDGNFTQDIVYAFNDSDTRGVHAGDASGSNGVSYSAGDDQENAVFGNVSGNSGSSISTDTGNISDSESASGSLDSSNAGSDVTKSTHIVHHDAVTHEEVVPATYTTIHHDATYTTVHHDAVTHEEIVPGKTYYTEGALPIVEGATAKTLCWPGGVDMEPSADQYGTTNIFWRTGECHNGAWTSNTDDYYAWTDSLNTNWSFWAGADVTLPSTTQTVVDQEAYDEQVVDQPEWDEQVVDVPEHTITVTDQEAWDEVVSD